MSLATIKGPLEEVLKNERTFLESIKEVLDKRSELSKEIKKKYRPFLNKAMDLLSEVYTVHLKFYSAMNTPELNNLDIEQLNKEGTPVLSREKLQNLMQHIVSVTEEHMDELFRIDTEYTLNYESFAPLTGDKTPFKREASEYQALLENNLIQPVQRPTRYVMPLNPLSENLAKHDEAVDRAPLDELRRQIQEKMADLNTERDLLINLKAMKNPLIIFATTETKKVVLVGPPKSKKPTIEIDGKAVPGLELESIRNDKSYSVYLDGVKLEGIKLRVDKSDNNPIRIECITKDGKNRDERYPTFQKVIQLTNRLHMESQKEFHSSSGQAIGHVSDMTIRIDGKDQNPSVLSKLQSHSAQDIQEYFDQRQLIDQRMEIFISTMNAPNTLSFEDFYTQRVQDIGELQKSLNTHQSQLNKINASKEDLDALKMERDSLKSVNDWLGNKAADHQELLGLMDNAIEINEKMSLDIGLDKAIEQFDQLDSQITQIQESFNCLKSGNVALGSEVISLNSSLFDPIESRIKQDLLLNICNKELELLSHSSRPALDISIGVPLNRYTDFKTRYDDHISQKEHVLKKIESQLSIYQDDLGVLAELDKQSDAQRENLEQFQDAIEPLINSCIDFEKQAETLKAKIFELEEILSSTTPKQLRTNQKLRLRIDDLNEDIEAHASALKDKQLECYDAYRDYIIYKNQDSPKNNINFEAKDVQKNYDHCRKKIQSIHKAQRTYLQKNWPGVLLRAATASLLSFVVGVCAFAAVNPASSFLLVSLMASIPGVGLLLAAGIIGGVALAGVGLMAYQQYQSYARYSNAACMTSKDDLKTLKANTKEPVQEADQTYISDTQRGRQIESLIASSQKPVSGPDQQPEPG